MMFRGISTSRQSAGITLSICSICTFFLLVCSITYMFIRSSLILQKLSLLMVRQYVFSVKVFLDSLISFFNPSTYPFKSDVTTQAMTPLYFGPGITNHYTFQAFLQFINVVANLDYFGPQLSQLWCLLLQFRHEGLNYPYGIPLKYAIYYPYEVITDLQVGSLGLLNHLLLEILEVLQQLALLVHQLFLHFVELVETLCLGTLEAHISRQRFVELDVGFCWVLSYV